MTDIEEGDRVIVDYKSHNEEYGGVASPWNNIEYAIGTVEEIGSERIYLKFYPDKSGALGIDGNPTGWTYEEFISECYEICDSCEEKKLYHDKQGEWLCPWCEL